MSSAGKSSFYVTKHEEISVVERIAAQPGYFVLSTTSGDDGCPADIHREPIIAWALEADSLTPYPVTAEGMELDNAPVQRPDGSVSRPYLDWFPSADEWLADEQETWRSERSIGGK